MKNTIIINSVNIVAKNDNVNIVISKAENEFIYEQTKELAKAGSTAEKIFEFILDNVKEDSTDITYDYSNIKLPDGFQVFENKIYFKDSKISERFCKRLTLVSQEQLKNINKFLTKLAEVDSRDVFESVCDFLACNPDIMIDADGDLLFWKHIGADFYAIHANPDGSRNLHQLNVPIEMPRHAVTRDKNITCSKGLHVCAKSYLAQYSGSVAVLCKVAVGDIVSIPVDYSNAKVRVCKYIPIQFFDSNGETIVQKCQDYENNYNGFMSEDIIDEKNNYFPTNNEIISVIKGYLTRNPGWRRVAYIKKSSHSLKNVKCQQIYNIVSKCRGFKVERKSCCSECLVKLVKE